MPHALRIGAFRARVHRGSGSPSAMARHLADLGRDSGARPQLAPVVCGGPGDRFRAGPSRAQPRGTELVVVRRIARIGRSTRAPGDDRRARRRPSRRTSVRGRDAFPPCPRRAGARPRSTSARRPRRGGRWVARAVVTDSRRSARPSRSQHSSSAGLKQPRTRSSSTSSSGSARTVPMNRRVRWPARVTRTRTGRGDRESVGTVGPERASGRRGERAREFRTAGTCTNPAATRWAVPVR